MKSDIYYIHNGKKMLCTSSASGEPDAVVMKFHAMMQNEKKVEYFEADSTNGKEKKSKEVIVPRYPKYSYKVVCVQRGGVWYDEFARFPTFCQKGEVPPLKGFGDPKEIEFPERLKEYA